MSLAQQLASIPRAAMRETKQILNTTIPTADSDSFERAFRAEKDGFDTPDHLSAVATYRESIKTRRNT
jgi:hypothetical protein